jgi:nucleoside triphosphate diphosphatase
MNDFKQLKRLMDIMAQLRDPDNGCPWDLEQDLKSLVPYTLEEAYELAEAIENENESETVKELGDLLFHLVFYAQLGNEQGLFNLERIAQTVSDKMIFRHPHVFSNHTYKNQQEFEKDWLKRKQSEKKQAQLSKDNTVKPTLPVSLMDDVSTSLPAMTRSTKLQKKAAHIGFDWNNPKDVLNKLKEEIKELEQEIEHVRENNDLSRIKDELGDVLFSCINLSRHCKLDPETILRQANTKFSERFRKMEEQYKYDHDKMEKASMNELEQIWAGVKVQ